jgi:diadenylate cyclase
MSFSDIVGRLSNIMQSVGFADILDIAIISVVIYYVLNMLKKTRAFQLMIGVGIFFAVYIVAITFKLKATTFLIDTLLQVGLIALLVVFQPELRRALEQVGSLNMFSRSYMRRRTYEDREVEQLRKAIAAICDGVERMSEKQKGALIVMENFNRLESVKMSGTPVNADITPELIGTIFYDGSPLHDGAVVVHQGRITHAGCVLPLSDSERLNLDLGTRHRAAVGMSEVSDAVVVVVSEETGAISVAVGGILKRHLAPQTLDRLLRNELCPEEESQSTSLAVKLHQRLQKNKSQKIKSEEVTENEE